MKKHIILVLVLLLIIPNALALTDQDKANADYYKQLFEGMGWDEDEGWEDDDTTFDMSDDEFDAYTESLLADEEAKQEILDRAIREISRYKSVFRGATFDRAQMIANYGTVAGGDFIASVNMTYPKMSSPKKDSSNILTVSINIAKAIADSCPEVVEAVVYWELPAYDSQAKVSFTIDADGTHYGDVMMPKVMADARK